MSSSRCSGYKVDRESGFPYCPAGEEPDADLGDTWQDLCEKCEDGAEAWDELLGDADRDEAE